MTKQEKQPSEQDAPALLNPLSEASRLAHGATDFANIRVEHYTPALKEAIARTRVALEAIKSNPSPANFLNTIVALETSGEEVSRISSLYFNLFGAEANEAHQSLASEISTLLADHSSDISLDQDLFARIRSVYDQKSSLQLDKEDRQLLENTHRSFVRNGALLDDDARGRLRNIDRELAVLGPKFSDNLLKATQAFTLEITDAKDLDGLPEASIEAYRESAIEKGHATGWLVTLDAPSFVPFMTYSNRRGLREKVWRAYSGRSFKDGHCNQEVIQQIVLLRQRRAQLLGYKNHAAYVLEERMAETPERVHKFLDRILSAAKPAAHRDLNEIKALKQELTGDPTIKPWDVAYYSEKLKEARYQIDQEQLRPYFSLDFVIQGVFAHAKKLYGLDFVETQLPVYHSDVRCYEVREEGDSQFVGLLYMDFFPRPTKKNGAWMTTYREQGLSGGVVQRPHVSIVCNFTKPTPNRPSLLSLDEVRTLFHEFGHALHSLLSNCRYPSLSGANVYWDFVELPSQIMENWVLEKEGLDLFARHYESGQAIPEEMTKKIKDSAQFMAGFQALRQLTYGYLDMAWHQSDSADKAPDVAALENEVVKDLSLLPREPDANVSCSFAHIFAGGYSAGYYSYKWAEVLEADAFELFKERGLFSKDVALSFRNHILSRGGSEHPMDLYIRFRGREPDPDALLRRDGLIP